MTSAEIMQMDSPAFAAWLRENRRKHKLAPWKLGQLLGIDDQDVHRLEKGCFCRRPLREVLISLFEELEGAQQRRQAKRRRHYGAHLFGTRGDHRSQN